MFSTVILALILISHFAFFVFHFSVTINNADKSTNQFCMNLEGRMAMAFLRCWER